ncbi:MAG TPA: hypothetical protein VFL90_12260, partial [Methylomirabilota bacterium]|nr:hypothetical protein [Methylomirabilota bacterium]
MSSKRTSAAERAALLVGVALVGWLVWRSRGWPLVHDAPLMHYVAWCMGQGLVPYRDVFDMNFPGAYLLHWAVLSTVGPGDVAWRVFDLGWLALTGALLAALAAPWGPTPALGAALSFALYHLAGGAWQAGQRDFLLCAFLLTGALGVARWLERAPEGGGRAALAGGGLALGAAVTIKPHAAALALALGVVLVVTAVRTSGGVAAPAIFGGTVLVVPIAVVAWLGAAGALPAWRAIVLDYLLPLYSRLGGSTGWTV